MTRPAGSGGLTGTAHLVRLALRRDRIVLPAWVLGIALLVVGTAAGFKELFQTEAERQGFAIGIGGNPAFRALYGQAYDLTTIGGATAWRMGIGAGTVAALMSIVLVVRHTRADEEAGRSELIGSTAVGQYAGLAAAVLVTALADVLAGVLCALGLMSVGQPAAGSFALGLAIATVGWTFAGVGAVAAQVASTARAAIGSAGVVLAALYVARGAADLVDSGLGWVSPLHWASEVRAFAGDRWLVLLLPVAVGALLVVVASVAVARRDFGAGLVSQRPGPARAGRALSSTWGLAWRLQRGLLIGWLVSFVAAGLLLGALTRDITSLLDESPQLKAVFEAMGGSGALVDGYFAAMVSLLGVVAAGYSIQVVLRLRAEETSGRAEPVLAAPVSRVGWSLPWLLWAFVGPAVLLLLAGVSLGVGDGLRSGDVTGQVTRLAGAALVALPGTAVLGGLAFALVGLLPRLATLAWAVFGLSVVLIEIGTGLKLPDWVLGVSPFHHLPRVPLEPVTATPLVALAAIAIVLSLAGIVGIRRRDLEA